MRFSSVSKSQPRFQHCLPTRVKMEAETRQTLRDRGCRGRRYRPILSVVIT